ncbi:hypothetical protein HYALB_00012511 [Hymenoscyphus albidus]|uniref:Uncharacterized protein n=1 Tax=Hymenoscyphus albidus TaxID=595503 RepID=A0A9N9LJY7_9HELO|nr:hypothetical protein HYALB_00012511 [Hymenoscyphus albidus]
MLFAIFLLGLLNLLTIASSTPAVLSREKRSKLCNDNTYAIAPTCSYLATYAEDIMEKCSEPGDPTIGTPSISCGQQFDTDNYNVIIMKNIDGECTGR